MNRRRRRLELVRKPSCCSVSVVFRGQWPQVVWILDKELPGRLLGIGESVGRIRITFLLVLFPSKSKYEGKEHGAGAGLIRGRCDEGEVR